MENKTTSSSYKILKLTNTVVKWTGVVTFYCNKKLQLFW